MESESGATSTGFFPQGLENAIAIVGMSCRFPGSNNAEEFWELLVTGKDGIGKVPSWRWVGDEHFADDSEVRNQTGGFLKCPVDEFDAYFFGFSHTEAEMMDPQLRLLLEVTWESLENAGINPWGLKGTKTGVFCGVWKQDYQNMLSKYNPKKGFGFTEELLANSLSVIPARIAHQLGVIGPNILTESGSASSMISVHLACQNLISGECNMAIVGGVNLLLQPFTRRSLKAEHLLSSDGRCKTFDASADGFGRAEGCASIVLKRYSDAAKNGDNILALIRGSAMNQDGVTKNFGIPNKRCQAACIEAALKKTGISPNMVSYVEAHGTGSLTGDSIEAAGLRIVYYNDRKEPLWVGSVKANVGHTESCAGLAGLVKVILALQNKTIPPHINCGTINPKINFKEIPASLPRNSVEWKADSHAPRIAGVNSFGMTGANVHVIVQEAPKDILKEFPKQNQQEIYQIMTISAKSEYSLNALIRQYQQVLQKHPNILKQFCYTANVGRAMFTDHRLAIVGKNSAEMVESIQKHTWLQSKEIATFDPKVVFLFTGQGSQYPAMGKVLYQNNSLFRENFDECAKIVEKHTKWSLANLFVANHSVAKQDELCYYQLAVLSIEYCLWKLWVTAGILPDFILGHSMGEFGAAVAAGILEIEDAIVLLMERCKLIETLPTGQMLAVRAGKEKVEQLLKTFMNNNQAEWVDLAIINNDSQTVVSGRNNAIQKFEKYCSDNSVMSIPIPSNRAFHSRDLEAILPRFDEVLSKVAFQTPKWKYISSNTGNLVTPNECDKNYWKRNTRLPVNFKKAFETAVEDGGRIFIEMGPQPILIGIGTPIVDKSISKDCLWVPSIRRGVDEMKTFLEGLGNLFVNGYDVDWESVCYDDGGRKISIPTYPFEHNIKYWIEKE